MLKLMAVRSRKVAQAARSIQAVARGRMTRRALLHRHHMMVRIQRMVRAWTSRVRVGRLRRAQAATGLQMWVRRNQVASRVDSERRRRAATRIACWLRRICLEARVQCKLRNRCARTVFAFLMRRRLLERVRARVHRGIGERLVIRCFDFALQRTAEALLLRMSALDYLDTVVAAVWDRRVIAQNILFGHSQRVICRAWRNHWRLRTRAAADVQLWYRFHRSRRAMLALERASRHGHAAQIQRVWRGCRGRQRAARRRIEMMMSGLRDMRRRQRQQAERREKQQRLRSWASLRQGRSSSTNGTTAPGVDAKAAQAEEAGNVVAGDADDGDGDDEEDLLVNAGIIENFVAGVIQRAWRSYRLRLWLWTRHARMAAAQISRWYTHVKFNATLKRHLMMRVRLMIYDAKEAAEEERQRQEREAEARYREYWARYEQAVVSCQRMWRFYRSLRQTDKATWIARASNSIHGEQRVRNRLAGLAYLEQKRLRKQREEQAAIKIQTRWRQRAAKKWMLMVWLLRDRAALLIQSTWRMMLGRRRANDMRAYHEEQAARERRMEYEQTPVGAAELARQDVLTDYDEAIHGTGVLPRVRMQVRARVAGARAFVAASVERRRDRARIRMREQRNKRRRKRVPTPEEWEDTRDDELQRGDIVKSRWRGGRVWWPAEILAVHDCCFVSQHTGLLVGDEKRTFDVRYLKDGVLDYRVPFAHLRFAERPSTNPPPPRPGARGFEPADLRLVETLVTAKNQPKHSKKERAIYARRKQQKAQLGIHRTAKTSLGLRSGCIDLRIVVGEKANSEFRHRRQRRVLKLQRRGVPLDRAALYYPAHREDLRMRVRRTTNDKLPVFIWVKKGPALRHMVRFRVARSWSKHADECKRLRDDPDEPWKELPRPNVVPPDELPKRRADEQLAGIRKRLAVPGPPSHWTRLPLTLWCRTDSVKAPIIDVRFSSYQPGHEDPRCEEHKLFCSGYIRLPEDLGTMGLDPGTFAWVKYSEGSRDMEDTILDRIKVLQNQSYRPSVTTKMLLTTRTATADELLEQHLEDEAAAEEAAIAAEAKAEDSAESGAERGGGQWRSSQRLWAVVEQLAIDDVELLQLREAYDAIDNLGNGYIDFADLVHSVGFDVVDMPRFFAYFVAMFPAEDDYGRPKEVRDLNDPLRFGDFVRILTVVCMLADKHLVRLCFNFADTTRTGSLTEDETYDILWALNESIPRAELRSLHRAMSLAIAKLDREPGKDPEVRFKDWKLMCKRFPRLLLPLRKLQHALSKSILGIKAWRKKKALFMEARRRIVKEMGLRRRRKRRKKESAGDSDGSDDSADLDGASSAGEEHDQFGDGSESGGSGSGSDDDD